MKARKKLPKNPRFQGPTPHQPINCPYCEPVEFEAEPRRRTLLDAHADAVEADNKGGSEP